MGLFLGGTSLTPVRADTGCIDRALAIVRTALDLGAFDRFGLPSGLVGDSLPENVGIGLDGSFGQTVGSQSVGLQMLDGIAGADFDGTRPLVAENYEPSFALKRRAICNSCTRTSAANGDIKLLQEGIFIAEIAVINCFEDRNQRTRDRCRNLFQ